MWYVYSINICAPEKPSFYLFCDMWKCERRTILRYMCVAVYFRLHLLVFLSLFLFFIFSLFKIRFFFRVLALENHPRSSGFLVICANYTHVYGANGVGYSLFTVLGSLHCLILIPLFCVTRVCPFTINHHSYIYAMPFHFHLHLKWYVLSYFLSM